MYINLNYNDSHQRKTTCTVLYTKSKKMRNVCIYRKSQTLFKKQDNFRYVFIHKSPDTLRYTIFHEIFEIGIYIYIQKALHFALHGVLTLKSHTLRKKQDNLRYVLFTKSQTLYFTRFLWFFLKFAVIYIKKKHDTLRYVTFLYTNSQTIKKKQDKLCDVF